ncbi:hypothetical protein Ahy_B08g090257 [Arachis hypogaea]|uniref:Uncharacterized protein n=1 Tax=Arachis hypogaea TaxID=3818 RepID=A0A444XZU8_ARAHY|nr:hypothetical protein Ahy_B08g090257 [Arachis hypogaea]
MTTSRGVADQAIGRGRGRGRGRVSSSTHKNSGFSPSTSTIPVGSLVASLAEQLFVLVPNPNYVPPSTTMTPPPTTQQPVATVTLSPATDAAAQSSHGSEAADVPPPPSIVRLTIWLDSGMGFGCLLLLQVPGYCFLFSGFRFGCLFALNSNACTQEMTNVIKLIYTLYGTLSTILPSDKYFTMEWVGDSSRYWRMTRPPDELASTRDKEGFVIHQETNEGFRHRRLTNRASRASVRSSKYTGSSTTFMKTKVKLSKSLDREVILAETFKYIHILKETTARFAYQRSQDHYVSKHTSDLLV